MQGTQKSNKSLSRQGVGPSLTLSLSENDHAVPFSPQDFHSPCEFVCRSHNTRALPASVHIKAPLSRPLT